MEEWKKCNSCKTPIFLNSKYYVCDVSTCNSKRTGYVFCSVPCWEVHLPIARHRDASAVEKIAPKVKEAEGGTRRIIRSAPTSAPTGATPKEVLIVASKLKGYIKARADMNTSGDVMNVLSEKVRELCDDAIDKARSEGRKTVLDRDF